MYLLLGKILHGAVKSQAVFASWKNPLPCKIICMEIFGILRCCVFGKILFHAIAGHLSATSRILRH
jgi:hypothetical protein